MKLLQAVLRALTERIVEDDPYDRVMARNDLWLAAMDAIVHGGTLGDAAHAAYGAGAPTFYDAISIAEIAWSSRWN